MTDPYGASSTDEVSIEIIEESNHAPDITDFVCEEVVTANHTGDPGADTAEVTCYANATDTDPFDHNLLSFEVVQLFS